jgi:signal transduction histidine kinase
MSLRVRIALMFAPLVLLLIGLGAAGVVLLVNLGNRAGEILAENYLSIAAMHTLTDTLHDLDAALVAGGRNVREQIKPLLQRCREQVDIELANITVPGEEEMAHELGRLFGIYEKRMKGDGAVADVEGMRAQSKQIRDKAEEIRLLNQNHMLAADQSARHTARISAWAVGAGLVVAVGLALVLGWRLAVSILRPIRTMQEAAHAIGQGQLQREVPVLAHDELGQLAEALNAMTAQLRVLRNTNLARLLRAQQTSQATIDSFVDPVVLIDPAGQVELANSAARQVLGVDPTGPPWQPPDALRGPLAEALHGQRVYLTESFDEVLTFRLQGEERSYLPRITPITDADGSTLGAALILHDVTRFRILDRFKSDLVATVGHELKTPLTAVRLAVHVLLEETIGPLTPKQTELLVDARDNSERLLKLIESLLALARLEHGRGEDKVPERPLSLLQTAAERIASRAADGHLDVVVQADPQLPLVAVEPVRFARALDNLLDNALRHTPPGGKIELTGERLDDGRILLLIHDTGVGIPPEFLPHVFDRFFRVPGRGGEGGTGLGLALVRETVLAHGGIVTCESPHGGGTTFRIILPSASREATP